MYVEYEFGERRKMHFSKNHNIRENNFDFQENYIYLHQNQQKRYEIQN